MKPTNVIVADSHELAVAGARHLVKQVFDLEVSTVVKDFKTLEEATETKAPTLLITDPYTVAGLQTGEFVQYLDQHPLIYPLLIISKIDQNDLATLIKRKTIGIITKTCSQREIVTAMEALQHDEKFLCNKVVEAFMQAQTSPGDAENDTSLSDREIEIVHYIAEGLSTEEIGDKLHLSPHTVHAHRKNILKKMNVKTPVELIVKAFRERILTL